MKKKIILAVFFASLFAFNAARQPVNPYDSLPAVAKFSVKSTDVKDNEKLPMAQMSGIFGAGGQDISPQLSWSGFPKGTKSFAVTMYDPDAPTASGFWHWAVVDIPVGVTSLSTGAGSPDGKLIPKGAVQLYNDAHTIGFIGAAPPAKTGRHHYYIVVHAVDVESLSLPKDASCAFLGFNLFSHTLGRAMIVPWAEKD